MGFSIREGARPTRHAEAFDFGQAGAQYLSDGGFRFLEG
jgi:hypothetical protein